MAHIKEKLPARDSVITEESVVAKVSELMETLDQIKKYNALAQSLKVFALIIIGSITFAAVLVALLDGFSLDSPFERTLYTPFLFVFPVINLCSLIAGVLYVRRKVNSVRTGEWKEDLAQGFPAALKMLLELDWDKTLGEIALGRISYALYSLLKTVGYWVVTTIALTILWRTVVFSLLQGSTLIGLNFVWPIVALFLVLLFLGSDLVKRYRELHALDMLLLELRWFSLEFQRVEL